MRMVYIFFFALAVFLNSIELSLQTDRSRKRNRNPSTSSSARQHIPAQTSDEKRPLPDRSRSPQGRPPSGEILGHALSELGYIRLIPFTNKRLQFEFRRYVFPVGKPIRVRFESSRFVPIPTREHIVLSTSNGDVFAILEYTEFLRGIYKTKDHLRVKINMISGTIDTLTSDEARDCPVGERHPILPYRFIKVVTKDDSLQFKWDPNSQEINPLILLAESSTQTDRKNNSRSPMGRPPSSEVLGYALRELGYIRLCPRTNPSLQLEFRRFVFPVSKPIRVPAGKNRHVHVPTREHIVLSASNGDVFALLEYSGILRGLYRPDASHARVKINMISGTVDNMTSDEVRDCPVGERHPIFPDTFTKVVTKYDSLESELNPNSERNPATSSGRQNSPDRPSTEKPSFSGRSRSPMGRPPTSEVLGYSLKELGYIQLCPRNNQSLHFEFRRYVFPDGEPIVVAAGRNRYVPVPTREHIVLSTSNGDILALLEHSGVLRGIYRPNSNRSRVKINMISGAVGNMTSDEARNCPVGENHPIFPQTFTKFVTKNDSLQSGLNYNSEFNPGLQSSASRPAKMCFFCRQKN